jgi:hypothetical protein
MLGGTTIEEVDIDEPDRSMPMPMPSIEPIERVEPVEPTSVTPATSASSVTEADVPVPPRPTGTSRSASARTAAPREPLPGAPVLRGVVVSGLSVLALLTLAGGVLMLLLWQQERSSGVLTNQIERTWELFDDLATIELIVALAVVPFATVWMVLAILNVCRASSRPTIAAVLGLSLPAALVAVWVIRTQVIEPSDDNYGAAGGVALQALALVVPLVVLEFAAGLVDARRRPHRAAYLVGVVWLAHMEFLGALSTTEVTTDPDEWGLLAAYLILGALLQTLGAMAVNETCRSFEEAAHTRHQMRRAFGEGVLTANSR